MSSHLQVYQIWLCPHRLYKLPVKTMVYPEPDFDRRRRQGDTPYARMYTGVEVYYAPGPVLRGEQFDGVETVRQLENWSGRKELLQIRGMGEVLGVMEVSVPLI